MSNVFRRSRPISIKYQCVSPKSDNLTVGLQDRFVG